MNNSKKMLKKISLLFSFLFVFTMTPILQPKTEIMAATKPVQLSATKLQINQGKTATIKLLNTAEKPVFKSSNTAVATVTKNGRIAGRNQGTATITATLKNKKKYTCKVTIVFQKKTLNTTIDPLAVTQLLDFTDGVSLQLPADWGCELYTHNDKRIQYVCFVLPDDEQNGCIYISGQPYDGGNVSLRSYSSSLLKKLIKKQQGLGYLVQGGSLGTIKTQAGVDLGVISFKSSKEGVVNYETVFIQKKGKYVFYYECICLHPENLHPYEKIALNVADSLAFDSTLVVQIP